MTRYHRYAVRFTPCAACGHGIPTHKTALHRQRCSALREAASKINQLGARA